MNHRYLLSALASLAVGATSAQAQVIKTDPVNNPVFVSSVLTYQTDFKDIVGMSVSWTLGSSGSDSGIWGAISDPSAPTGSFGIWDANFHLYQNGNQDTYDQVWNLWACDLLSFTLDAIPGNAVFDMINSPAITAGSSLGQKFDWLTPDGLTHNSASTVTYYNPIIVSPALTVPKPEDLFGKLTVSFGSWENGDCLVWNDPNHHDKGCKTYQQVWIADPFGATSSGCGHDGASHSTCFATFLQDMDNVDGISRNTETTVPEPATMTLLATGLVGMMAASRRRRRKN